MYYRMGRVVAGLHANGLTLPPEDLLNPSNYGVDSEGGMKVATLAAMEKMVPLQSPRTELSQDQRLGILLSAALTVPQECWTLFGAGYLEESSARGQGESVGTVLRRLGLKLTRVWEAKALHAQALAMDGQGKHHESIETLEREIEIYRETGLGAIAGRVYVNLGTAYGSAGSAAEALRCYETAYGMALDHDDRYGHLVACVSLALEHARRGDSATSGTFAREGLQAMDGANIPSTDKEAIRSRLAALAVG